VDVFLVCCSHWVAGSATNSWTRGNQRHPVA
jgi:hypothetical protein